MLNFNFNFSDYIAVMAIIFLIASIISFKERAVRKFVITMYMVFTILTASVIMINFSFTVGMMIILTIIVPFATFRKRNKENSKN